MEDLTPKYPFVPSRDKLLPDSSFAPATVIGNNTITPNQIVNNTTQQAIGGPGGSDTNVQYNDGGSFGGDSNLVWDKTNRTLTVSSASASDALVVRDTGLLYALKVLISSSAFVSLYARTLVSGAGATLRLFAGDAFTGGGGDIVLNGGTPATNGAGGDVDINPSAGNGSGTGGEFVVNAGNGDTTGAGGLITLKTGNGGASGGDAGILTLQGGNAAAGQGGIIVIEAGSATAGDHMGGDIEIVPGAGHGTGRGGNLFITGSNIATNSTAGFPVITNMSGSPSAVPSGGQGSMVFDITNNKLFIYNGTAWKSVTLT